MYYFQSEKPRKPRKQKKEKDANKPKRPPTAFMIWLNSAREKIKADNPGIAVTEIAKKGGEMWRELKDKSVSLHSCIRCTLTFRFRFILMAFVIIFRNGNKKRQKQRKNMLFQ